MSCCGEESLMVGGRPTVRGRFTIEVAGVETLSNPSAITVITRDPSGDQITYVTPNAAISQVSTGIWQFEFPAPVTEAGTWWVYMRGDSGVHAANQIKLKIKGANVTV